MKRIIKTFTFLTAFVLFGATSAFAAEGNIFSTITSKIGTTLLDLQQVIFILGGLGMVAFAFAAVFGRISFRHLSYLSFSLFLVAAMGPFVRYFTNDNGALTELQYQDYCSNHDCSYSPEVQVCETCYDPIVCDSPECDDDGDGGGGGSNPNRFNPLLEICETCYNPVVDLSLLYGTGGDEGGDDNSNNNGNGNNGLPYW